MYAGYGFRNYEIGDVDVVWHAGKFHLFHLTLPNHDYIAHAVSEDGLTWERVQNALFISDPRNWDDDMLWTMHVTPDPYREGGWRMFYTGLCMAERGRIQRIGMARSRDLYAWEKDESGAYPLEMSGPHYEKGLDEGRHWVSFRDPFYFRLDGDGYLLASARVNQGPVIRRGCVALLEEQAENEYRFRPPLYHPMLYDDIEVPNLIQMGGRFYLIGSIREDIKVHYWLAETLEGPYKNFHDNVLLPQGNYAARVMQLGERYLIWNFFFKGLDIRGEHLLAPPKELAVDEEGQLGLRSFQGFEQLVEEQLGLEELAPLQRLFNNPHGRVETDSEWIRFGSESGFEAFLLTGVYGNFILTGELELEGSGKCGLVLRLNDEGDGYYLSLELFKGIVQLRAWRFTPEGGFEASFKYQQLQAAHFVPRPGPHTFQLLVYDEYIEFCLHDVVLLTLADNQFNLGRTGFYVESGWMQVRKLEMKVCGARPTGSYPEGVANY